MRGFLNPAVRPQITDQQKTFRGLSRHRRTKLARAAHTNLLKADQWSRGGLVPGDVAAALESALTLSSKKKAR
jgi:hypothetical protein